MQAQEQDPEQGCRTAKVCVRAASCCDAEVRKGQRPAGDQDVRWLACGRVGLHITVQHVNEMWGFHPSAGKQGEVTQLLEAGLAVGQHLDGHRLPLLLPARWGWDC